jgi:hypothetical protein
VYGADWLDLEWANLCCTKQFCATWLIVYGPLNTFITSCACHFHSVFCTLHVSAYTGHHQVLILRGKLLHFLYLLLPCFLCVARIWQRIRNTHQRTILRATDKKQGRSKYRKSSSFLSNINTWWWPVYAETCSVLKTEWKWHTACNKSFKSLRYILQLNFKTLTSVARKNGTNKWISVRCPRSVEITQFNFGRNVLVNKYHM